MPKKQHPDRPDELERLAPLAPLVEQGEREDEGEDRGQRPGAARGHGIRRPSGGRRRAA